jgi:hypothetical protein
VNHRRTNSRSGRCFRKRRHDTRGALLPSARTAMTAQPASCQASAAVSVFGSELTQSLPRVVPRRRRGSRSSGRAARHWWRVRSGGYSYGEALPQRQRVLHKRGENEWPSPSALCRSWLVARLSFAPCGGTRASFARDAFLFSPLGFKVRAFHGVLLQDLLDLRRGELALTGHVDVIDFFSPASVGQPSGRNAKHLGDLTDGVIERLPRLCRDRALAVWILFWHEMATPWLRRSSALAGGSPVRSEADRRTRAIRRWDATGLHLAAEGAERKRRASSRRLQPRSSKAAEVDDGGCREMTGHDARSPSISSRHAIGSPEEHHPAARRQGASALGLIMAKCDLRHQFSPDGPRREPGKIIRAWQSRWYLCSSKVVRESSIAPKRPRAITRSGDTPLPHVATKKSGRSSMDREPTCFACSEGWS